MLHNMFITNVHNMFITNLILRTATRRFLWVRRAHAQLCGRARPFICSLFLCAGARRVAENRCDRREKLQSSFERRQHCCHAVFFAVSSTFPRKIHVSSVFWPASVWQTNYRAVRRSVTKTCSNTARQQEQDFDCLRGRSGSSFAVHLIRATSPLLQIQWCPHANFWAGSPSQSAIVHHLQA